ncbi:MAG TPA: DNA repair ATPase [Polyangiaceae bacterium]|nr:DNA repair ATPase [Polyangiaceae bacterium]
MVAEETPASETKLEGGSYEVIRRRLLDRAAELGKRCEALNAARSKLFGGRELALLATDRVRTENNCVPRDVVSVAGHLLFGFQVFIGLKSETKPSDALSTYRFQRTGDAFDLSSASFDGPLSFLANPDFAREFSDVFRYYKDARLLQLRRTDTRLLIVTQIGATERDVKVFRFAIDAQSRVSYMDARGEEDAVPPRPHAFAWTPTTREDQVSGKHPHVNILNEVFVETVGGDLTVKIENNTQDGLGIYREPVDDPNQTLDDAEIAYAKLGSLILLKIRPFREEKTRYLVYNSRTEHVLREDSIGQSCLELPENHGIIFPAGYYLESGEYKVFTPSGIAQRVERVADLRIERVLPSPNGEDVLFVFYREDEGEYELMPYNLIKKEVQTPIRCHGYSLFPDGTMLIFRATPGQEPTRVHPVQVWQTPFTTLEFAASAPTDGSYLAKVGNADLVAGISEALTVQKLAKLEQPTRRSFEDVVSFSQRLLDANHWLGHPEAFDLASVVRETQAAAALIIDEFEKLRALEKAARDAVNAAEEHQKQLLDKLRPSDLRSVDAFLGALSALKKQRGALVSLDEVRSVDHPRVAELQVAIAKRFDEVSAACVGFFLSVDAFKPLLDELDQLVRKIEASKTAGELSGSRAELDRIHEGLTLLAETINGLKVADPTARTAILDGTSSAFAKQNRARAIFDGRYQELSVNEGRAEFAVQFKLLGQNVVSALSLAKTPETCDEQLGKLMLQLEELESKFGEFAEFAPEIAEKREEVLAAIATKRQAIVEERQRRAQNFAVAAERILSGIVRRAQNFKELDELNTFFISDPTLGKLEELREQLLELGDSVRAEELDAKLKAARQTALRALRDKTELSGGGDDTIRFGEHRFLLNTQPLELTIVAREGGLFSHLTGTDFYEPLNDAGLELGREFWNQALVSESADVYRGEYLAVAMLLDAEAGRAGLSANALSIAAREERLPELVRAYAAERLDEGYEPGVHDADAAIILSKILVLQKSAGLLSFSANARGLAWLYWQSLPEDKQDLLSRRAASIGRLRSIFGDAGSTLALAREFEAPIADYAASIGLKNTVPALFAARYLIEELGQPRPSFTVSAHAEQLQSEFQRHLEDLAARRGFEEDLALLEAHGPERIGIALAYVDAFLKQRPNSPLARYRLEVVARFIALGTANVSVSTAPTETVVSGLLGTHPRVVNRELSLALDELLERVSAFIEERAPRYRSYKKLRAEVAARERARLRLDEFSPRVLTSFVRNRLIDEVYLPLIGANLAKQLGAAGKTKRTDLMGLLLLVSPPGYGKTTLMEYVASRLGLVFVKVNGPALGTSIVSLDPSEAHNATARQEVEKINLALEMGNNVMLYLDDIQHTNPELLQKFISLCDAQRRIEGIWNGRSRTYDLRGKKFCIVMAGNPYTESGARFQIPDMLANRADTYNLGDILHGKEQAFALSYLENSLTSNAVLAPLAGREPADVHKLVAMAQGEEVPVSELSHDYGAAEVEEFVALFKRLLQVQRTLLRVNQEYIASASQDDRYRSEPQFKLQGSYRNMNKLAEKLAAAMNDAELERLVDDHYASEAQTLTRGAEQNLLKLAEMRGRQSEEQKARWGEIKDAFVRVQRMGGKDEDPVARVTGSLSLLDDQLKGIREALGRALTANEAAQTDGGEQDALRQGLESLSRPKLEVTLHGAPPQELARLAREQLALLRELLGPILSGGLSPANDGQAQRLGEIAAAITGMQRTIERGMSRPERVDVSLVGHSKTNFWRPVSSDDVCSLGGLFVATYEKPPALGAPIELSLAFPSGPTCSVFGAVAYTQDELSDDFPAGFGVRFSEVSPEARALIEEYASVREPLLRDD